MMFSMTVRHGRSTAFWKTMPISERGAHTGSPATRTSPSVGDISPARMRRSVLLPQPLGPTSDTNSPCSMPSETERSAWISPSSTSKVLATPSSSMKLIAPELWRAAVTTRSARVLLGVRPGPLLVRLDLVEQRVGVRALHRHLRLQQPEAEIEVGEVLHRLDGQPSPP